MKPPSWTGYVVDPDDPRAPPADVWERMSPEEREQVVRSLPIAVPEDLAPPEGDFHRKAKTSAVDALESFFRRSGRKVYVSSELGVYYPGEPRFAPDVLAVLDVEPHERNTWIVSKEGRGLDFVLEVHVAGNLSKDAVRNVERYAVLGIGEYFFFNRVRGSLQGYRLPSARARVYERIAPQAGRYTSVVLGLDLGIEDDRLRFYAGTAALADAPELIDQLGRMLNNVVVHKEELVSELEEERRLRAEEQHLLEEERRLRAGDRYLLEQAQHARDQERLVREEAQHARDQERLVREAAQQAWADTQRKLDEALAELARVKASQQ